MGGGSELEESGLLDGEALQPAAAKPAAAGIALPASLEQHPAASPGAAVRRRGRHHASLEAAAPSSTCSGAPCPYGLVVRTFVKRMPGQPSRSSVSLNRDGRAKTVSGCVMLAAW
ncbi:hypothetical protein TSOC_004698 [Tetrabaena socialis]|uniref:Uncharacterized protein n=1 Tax=Tetrabaena socialis TaxID=47790 RepID=A0A2J8A8A7_9CHLO|nr:hypothetical protein TSOC_004698 [Tetrabaena socialis]|eukprot:PNH08730.1 hypothetical protein TSOC_004698 [Tetrabaena socialis]